MAGKTGKSIHLASCGGLVTLVIPFTPLAILFLCLGWEIGNSVHLAPSDVKELFSFLTLWRLSDWQLYSHG